MKARNVQIAVGLVSYKYDAENFGQIATTPAHSRSQFKTVLQHIIERHRKVSGAFGEKFPTINIWEAFSADLKCTWLW
jgi:hypothetical protein